MNGLDFGADELFVINLELFGYAAVLCGMAAPFREGSPFISRGYASGFGLAA